MGPRPTRSTKLESKPKGKDSRKGKPSATVSAARQKIRRRSDTGTDNTKYTRTKEAHMPAVKTTKSTTKSAPRRRATKADAAVESLTLTLAKAPSGKGGFLYNDANDHDEKLHVTSMYLSQDAIAKMFEGEAPDSLTISA